MVTHLEALFPGLQGSTYQITSPPDDVYNCIAWAAGDTKNFWWPDPVRRTFWPVGVSRAETIPAFRDAFATLGYVTCIDAEYEHGFEKIALFAHANGFPTHADRQLPNGRWTSKIGELEDIEHELDALVGTEYGLVVEVLKRPFAAPAGGGPAPMTNP